MLLLSEPELHLLLQQQLALYPQACINSDVDPGSVNRCCFVGETVAISTDCSYLWPSDCSYLWPSASLYITADKLLLTRMDLYESFFRLFMTFQLKAVNFTSPQESHTTPVFFSFPSVISSARVNSSFQASLLLSNNCKASISF